MRIGFKIMKFYGKCDAKHVQKNNFETVSKHKISPKSSKIRRVPKRWKQFVFFIFGGCSNDFLNGHDKEEVVIEKLIKEFEKSFYVNK